LFFSGRTVKCWSKDRRRCKQKLAKGRLNEKRFVFSGRTFRCWSKDRRRLKIALQRQSVLSDRRIEEREWQLTKINLLTDDDDGSMGGAGFTGGGCTYRTPVSFFATAVSQLGCRGRLRIPCICIPLAITTTGRLTGKAFKNRPSGRHYTRILTFRSTDCAI